MRMTGVVAYNNINGIMKNWYSPCVYVFPLKVTDILGLCGPMDTVRLFSCTVLAANGRFRKDSIIFLIFNTIYFSFDSVHDSN